MGSVSKYVVEHAPCNVTVVPHHDHSDSHTAAHPAPAAHPPPTTKLEGNFVYTQVPDHEEDE